VTPVDAATVAAAVDAAAGFSDTSADGLAALAQVFLAAHAAVPAGLSCEIGTRAGGSARLFAALLAAAYPAGPPLLVTVDPYGAKPYACGGAYGDEYGLAAKHVLAPYAFHTHFRLRGVDYLRAVAGAGLPYWQRGVAATFAGPYTFIYLDGDHNFETIRAEVTLAWPLVAPGGVIVIDNVTADPATVPWLTAHSPVTGLPPDGRRGDVATLWRPAAAAAG
jgi:predicted O-methyltransferase YrrM